MKDGNILNGLFVNTTKENCSIYESGIMCFNCLNTSGKYKLDYTEINIENRSISAQYDFYIFNYHPWQMTWMDTAALHATLPGKKFTIVLEVAPNNPFVYVNDQDFDGYLVLDPSVILDHPKVFPFVRPLELNVPVAKQNLPGVPVIGSFGFSTPGKGFELLVDAVNKEFDQAIVKINVPAANKGTQDNVYELFRRDYIDYLEELCKKVAKPGIEVVFTREYFTKEALINWCAGNTLNCFMYNRYQTGLSATTDQAIVSGRPLAVSSNETFRHIHRYIKPYPYRSLKESIAYSISEVQQMKNDWTVNAFQKTFEQMLAQSGCKHLQKSESLIVLKNIKEPPPQNIKASFSKRTIVTVKKNLYPFYRSYKNIFTKYTAAPPSEFYLETPVNIVSENATVLFVSHSSKKCGIHEFGWNIKETLKKLSSCNLYYAECNNAEELDKAVVSVDPDCIIYNYDHFTMPWLNKKIAAAYSITQIGYVHKFNGQNFAEKISRSFFDYYIFPDPSIDLSGYNNCFKTGRLLTNYLNNTCLPAHPVIGSYGFGFSDKGFERLVTTVQQQFDKATIRLNIPFSDSVHPGEKEAVLPIARRCRRLVTKPGIRLEITHNYFSQAGILHFLASNSINVFLYDANKDHGISSVLDYALSVQRPVAISSSGMFRHMQPVWNKITVENNSLQSIMENGIAPLVPFYNEWNEARMIMTYEAMLDKVLNASAGANNINHRSFNKLQVKEG